MSWKRENENVFRNDDSGIWCQCQKFCATLPSAYWIVKQDIGPEHLWYIYRKSSKKNTNVHHEFFDEDITATDFLWHPIYHHTKLQLELRIEIDTPQFIILSFMLGNGQAVHREIDLHVNSNRSCCLATYCIACCRHFSPALQVVNASNAWKPLNNMAVTFRSLQFIHKW